MLQLLSVKRRNDHLEKTADFQGGEAVNGTFSGLHMTVNPDALWEVQLESGQVFYRVH